MKKAFALLLSVFCLGVSSQAQKLFQAWRMTGIDVSAQVAFRNKMGNVKGSDLYDLDHHISMDKSQPRFSLDSKQLQDNKETEVTHSQAIQLALVFSKYQPKRKCFVSQDIRAGIWFGGDQTTGVNYDYVGDYPQGTTSSGLEQRLYYNNRNWALSFQLGWLANFRVGKKVALYSGVVVTEALYKVMEIDVWHSTYDSGYWYSRPDFVEVPLKNMFTLTVPVGVKINLGSSLNFFAEYNFISSHVKTRPMGRYLSSCYNGVNAGVRFKFARMPDKDEKEEGRKENEFW